MKANKNKFKTDLRSRCYSFSLNLIRFINNLPKNNSNLVISNQILRSGTSVGANLVEALASSTRVEFKKFHEIALKSANETKYWLELIGDSNDEKFKDEVNFLLKELDEISRMIAASVLKIKGKKF